MYIVTFYSFKGGTGRSMALVNVAAELLTRGRRVLIVDFDLEAPGLDTFPIKVRKPIGQGLVDIIHDYLQKDEVPDVCDYLYEANVEGISTGKLWLMPAGCQDARYDSKFKNIDWLDFYNNQGGFLFFEDIKVQWSDSLNPDYVLIDSRTGHTDTGGICTRQIPNCVVAMFIPNEQNLRGLKPVVDDIRKEETGPLKKKIDLHFVIANLPDLDDDHEILDAAISASQEALGYTSLAATIHHFNSLTMLEQRLMTVDRPRSKLAIEYKQLTSAIIRQNLEDKEGALAQLEEIYSSVQADGESQSSSFTEDRLQTIRLMHAEDVDILRLVARIRRAQRRIEEALAILDSILAQNPLDSESLVARAEINTIVKKDESARSDLSKFFGLAQVSEFNFSLAVKLKLFSEKEGFHEIVESPAVPSFSGFAVVRIAEDFQRRYSTVPYAVTLLERWMQTNVDIGSVSLVKQTYTLCLIGSGLFERAMNEILGERKFSDLEVHEAFNYAMAQWGALGTVPTGALARVANQVLEDTPTTHSNLLQCFSLANWAAGNMDRAADLLSQAIERVTKVPERNFSCWSYLYRSPKLFIDDLKKMKSLYEGEEIIPSFIKRYARPTVSD